MELSDFDFDIENEVDNTEELEFPNYVCYEIINEIVKLVMENSMDPRLQSNMPINQSIAPIGGQ